MRVLYDAPYCETVVGGQLHCVTAAYLLLHL